MRSLATAHVDNVENAILLIRGERVILDSDLATLYGVTTARLNQQVNRNLERFPSDFMFQLTRKEYNGLMLQIATSKGRGGFDAIRRLMTPPEPQRKQIGFRRATKK